MKHVIGIVPAGGRAKRIHGFFKEMMPIGISEHNKSRFIVSSERIISALLEGGASSVHFLLSAQKSFIAEYYAKQEIFTGQINFNYITNEIEELGMPYALDSIYDQTKDADFVYLGMPDTVIDPQNCFLILRNLLETHGGDLALGLFATDNRNQGGFVQFDRASKAALGHIDKTSTKFPRDANNAWAVVCWNRKFTDFMHEALRNIRKGRSSPRDLLFGRIIDEAIADPSIRVVADYINEESGFYWDIADPEKYFNLLRTYYSIDAREKVSPRDRIFIGHGRSPVWKDLKNFLHERLKLEWEEFNRISPAGVSTQERLTEMMKSVSMAFLIMTGEDEKNGNLHARENVIHEIGLFQGVLGCRRAIVLLEDGCQEFSNIRGLTQIRFPKGNIAAVFEEVRLVIERESVK